MDQSLEVTNVKNKLIIWTSSDRLKNSSEIHLKDVKKESDCLVQSEIDIKTESEDDEAKFPVIVSTSYDMCHNYDMKIETEEPLIKTEYENVLGEILQDPLDVGDEIKVEESFSSDLNQGELRIKPEPTDRENVENLLESDAIESYGSKSIKGQDQLLIRNEPDRKNKQYVCSECNKNFDKKSNFDRHLQIHTGEKPFTCDVCEKSFTRKSHKRRHMLIHSGEKPHTCYVCKKSFSDKSYLCRHKLIHSGIKSFSCDECDKSFTTKTNLVTHKRLHTGEKPFSCDHCDKTFTQKIILIEHRRLHTEEKPYSCDICNKSFTQNSTLIGHKRLHAEEKPFSCDICNKSFKRKSNLNQHKKIHKK